MVYHPKHTIVVSYALGAGWSQLLNVVRTYFEESVP